RAGRRAGGWTWARTRRWPRRGWSTAGRWSTGAGCTWRPATWRGSSPTSRPPWCASGRSRRAFVMKRAGVGLLALGVFLAADLKSGAARWRLDLGKDPAVAAPGMVYGGPVVHRGRLYLATCNLAGEFANKPTAVVCIGEK